MDASARESSLRSARQKLKSYRARQNRASGSTSAGSTASIGSSTAISPPAIVSPSTPSRRTSQHAHKRSNSRTGASVVMPTATRRHSRSASLAQAVASASAMVGISMSPAVVVEPVTPMSAPVAGARRGSASRRHSRTDSILSAHDVGPSPALLPAATPAISGLSTWSFPASPQPGSASPASSTFATQQAQRRANRQSLPYPTPSAPKSAGRPASLAVLSPALSSSGSSTPTPPTAGPVHARKLSRHGRKASLASRRESLELMGGLAAPVEQISPIASPRPQGSPLMSPPSAANLVARSGALDALEGRVSPALDEAESFDFSTFAQSASASLGVVDKRASWGNPLASSMTVAGGKGAIDLGMLVEEEEEDEEADQDSGEVADRSAALSEVTDFSRSTKQRPTSLFLPSTRIGAAINPSDSAAPTPTTPALMSARRPLNSSVSSVASVAMPQTPGSDAGSRQSFRNSLLNQSVTPSASSTVIPIGARRRATSIHASSPAAGSSKRSSITYRGVTPNGSGFGDLVMATSPPASSAESHALVQLQATVDRLTAELSAVESRANRLDEELREERRGAGDHASRLHEAQGELAALRAELETERAERAVELERLKIALGDVEAERDDLAGDINGWRARCSDLSKQVERAQATLESERREGAVAREKVRKLGDRLAAANSAAPDAALAAAQAKLITEMRDQLFALAAALEREKQAHAAAVASASAAPPAPSAARTNSDASSIASLASFGTRSFSGGNTTVDTSADEGFSFTKDVATSSPPSSKHSSAFGSNSLGSSIGYGANVAPAVLDTLAEVSEDDEDAASATAVVQAPGGGRHNSGSTGSCVSEIMPRTPVHETAEPRVEVAPHHERSDSFIKQWTFPRGPVEPVTFMHPEDHAFFSIAGAKSLPPLPIDERVLALPPFFTADLVLDDAYYSKRASAPATPDTLPEPTVRAIPLGRAASTPAPFNGRSPGPRELTLKPAAVDAVRAANPSRMSLQNFGSLVASYVTSKPVATAPPAVVRVASTASSGSSSTQASDPTPTSFYSRAPSPSSRPTIVASPLGLLDFTVSVAREGVRIIRI